MSDDFFNSVSFFGQKANQIEPVDCFAQAIAARFGSPDILTARLLPDESRKHISDQLNPPNEHVRLLKPPLLPLPLIAPSSFNEPLDAVSTSPSLQPSSDQSFTPISPSMLTPSYLSDASTLILDIRPHAAHASARILGALPLSVPSTLLKRPLFSLSKLAQMLPSAAARTRFSTWPSVTRILAYDVDSTHLLDSSNITGLFRKFRTEGFTGELIWVRGGFQAVWRESRESTTTEQPSPHEDDGDPGDSGLLRTSYLPKSAFSTSTTHLRAGVGVENSYLSQTPVQTMPCVANPFFDAIRQNVELAQGITERIPLRLPKRVRRRINDLPFPWIREIARRSAVRRSIISESESGSGHEQHGPNPGEDRPEVEEGTEALAMQFYRIELAEQRRMRAIMEHHSRESGATTEGSAPNKTVLSTPRLSSFPFSIIAGVEKGTKNRYTHIWPFEHARVHLHGGRHKCSFSTKRSGGKTVAVACIPTKGGKDQGVLELNSLSVMTETSKSLIQPPLHMMKAAVVPDNNEGHAIAHPHHPGNRVTSGMQTDMCSSRPPTAAAALPAQTPKIISPLKAQRLLLLPTPGPRPTVNMDVAVSGKMVSPPFSLCLPYQNEVGDMDMQQDVKLLAAIHPDPSPPDDYVNASYVQPLGTHKRYIATQGPLPATFVDFWTLVWEQNVHVIVMLTREVENAMVKCGTYWTDMCYGPFQLELLSTSPPVSPSVTANSSGPSKQGFFFAIHESLGKESRTDNAPITVTRLFALSHTSYPDVPPRRITHLQYLDWPDLNVPEDPTGVLDLVKRVERAAEESNLGQWPSNPGDDPNPSPTLGSTGVSPGAEESGQDLCVGNWRHPDLDPKSGIATFIVGKPPPVLLHCSAGVGRTGGFIAVDAVLDGIRREMRKRRENGIPSRAAVNGKARQSDDMDVDKCSCNGGRSLVQPQVYQDTVPLHVSAGGPWKSQKHDCNPTDKHSFGTESLVLHIPVAGRAAGNKELDGPPKNLRTAGWEPSSTREWAAHVSHQVRSDTEGQQSEPLTTPISLSSHPTVYRTRSPGSSSSGSNPLPSSLDDLVTGSIERSAIERSDHTASAPLSALIPDECGSALGLNSESASGTGPSSRFGSIGSESPYFVSLLHPNATGSSFTSLSNPSAESFPLAKLPKGFVPIRQPSSWCASSSMAKGMDMDIDHPPRAISVPPQCAHQGRSANMEPQHAVRTRQKPLLGSSPLASFSAPSLMTGPVTRRGRPFGIGESESRTSSNPSSDEMMSPLQEFECNSMDAESVPSMNGSLKSSEVTADEPEDNVTPWRILGIDMNEEHATCESEDTSSKLGKDITPLRGVANDHRVPNCTTLPIPVDAEQETCGDYVKLGPGHITNDSATLEYKAPRQLHTDLSPPLLSSYQNPIWEVIQDMREQRMSLCQSLRQYVFVHAAVVEGALQIVDEERELWGDGDNAPKGDLDECGEDFEDDSQGYRVRGKCGAVSAATCSNAGQFPLQRPAVTVTNASSATPSSPTKGKRGPSPTELFKEDKLGALSLFKRPSMKRKSPCDAETASTFGDDAFPSRPGSGVAVTGMRAAARHPTITAAAERGATPDTGTR